MQYHKSPFTPGLPGLPAIEFPWFFFSSMMKVQAQLCVNAKTTVIVHLYNLAKKKKNRIISSLHSQMKKFQSFQQKQGS